MEVQVLDDRAANMPRCSRSSTVQLYGITAPKSRVSKPAGEWQTMKIVCQGREVQVTLNGTQISSTNLNEQQAHAKEHPGINRASGHVGLQNHGTRSTTRTFASAN